jgi:hypothetical protein
MMPYAYAARKRKSVTRAVLAVSSALFVILLVARPAIRGKGKLLGLHRVWSERPRVAGRYSGCYVRTTVSGDSSDHTLASDAHLHTLAGTRGVTILLHSHQDGANVRAARPSFLSCCRLPHRRRRQYHPVSRQAHSEEPTNSGFLGKATAYPIGHKGKLILANLRPQQWSHHSTTCLMALGSTSVSQMASCHAIDFLSSPVTIPITIACPAVQSNKVYPPI